MKKILIGIMLMFTLSSCYTTKYIVEGAHKLDGVYSNPQACSTNTNGNAYEDTYVTIIPESIDPKINLTIWNKYTSSIRVLWDEAAYIDVTGNTHRVIHTGVKFTDKEKAQVASVIPAGAKLEDVAVPVECIELIGGTWTIIPFESYKFDSLTEAENLVSILEKDPNLCGCTLLLPILVDDKKIEYTLRFNGDKYSISSKEEYDEEATLTAYIITLLGSTILPLIIAGIAVI